MTEARITRVLQDVVGEGDVEARVTRVLQDVVGEGPVEARVTRVLQDVVGEGPVEARVTRVILIVLADPALWVVLEDVVLVTDELIVLADPALWVVLEDVVLVTDELSVQVELGQRELREPVPSEGYDIANPNLVRDAGLHDPPPLGQYQINDRGDYALDSRLQGLRKRILRRIATFRGGFFHLPRYGVALPIKGPLQPGAMLAMAAEIRSQVQREPEVLRAQVTVEQHPNSPFVLVITVRARATRGLDVVASQTLDLRRPAP